MDRPLLRPGLLDGVAVCVAGAGGYAGAVAAAGSRLGAAVSRLPVDPAGEEPSLAEIPAVDQLVWDGAGAFGDGGGVDALRAALDGGWLAIRPVANRDFIPEARGGRIVLLAPLPGDAHAAAARAGLENLARTLSIEWSRFGIRTVAIVPGAATTPETVAELCAFLASPAGDYHSGSVLALS